MLTASLPSFADSSHQPAITEVRAEVGMIHIFGLNLGGASPRVTLGSLSLPIASATPTQIDALIPAGSVVLRGQSIPALASDLSPETLLVIESRLNQNGWLVTGVNHCELGRVRICPASPQNVAIATCLRLN
jgi:hypothetical protein